MVTTIEQDLLFEEAVRLTQVVDYGFSWEDFVTRRKPIPASGLRFDIYFDGNVSGDQLSGRIKGVDYLTVRADGRLLLTLHATINTSDGALIKVTESGINDNGQLRLNMDFHTNDARYDWINHKHVWGIGHVDFETFDVSIKAYQH